MKILSFTWLLLAALVSGCATAKRQPIPVSEVHFYEKKGDFAIGEFAERPEIHFDYRGRADGLIRHPLLVSRLTDRAQYLGRVLWSGTIPEVYVSESQAADPGLVPLTEVPLRVKEEFKKRAAAKGANLVILNLQLGNVRWILENGRLQPEYLLYSKAYYSTNLP